MQFETHQTKYCYVKYLTLLLGNETMFAFDYSY